MVIFMKLILKYIGLWSCGAYIYGLIEIAFRGYTHISMGILGGICLIIIGSINKIFGFDVPLLLQMVLSAIIITSLEFITGIIVNVWLGLDIWDYSCMQGNIMGQICPVFFFVWLFLSLPAIFLDDYIRYFMFGEQKPHYRITGHIFKTKKA